jgi:hypothetical protein
MRRRKVVALHIPTITTTMNLKRLQATLSLLITGIASARAAQTLNTIDTASVFVNIVPKVRIGVCLTSIGPGMAPQLWVCFDCIIQTDDSNWNYRYIVGFATTALA